MSGITGWVDRGRDLTQHSDLAAAMTSRLTRGGHGDRQWHSPHALLGHSADAQAPRERREPRERSPPWPGNTAA
ncbi:hypothetical protein GXW82_02175 [Streptacidiphilus sp. 4-A2]|nr:hypothetical protein [Streptacidiphilus sp. 4-A2]